MCQKMVDIQHAMDLPYLTIQITITIYQSSATGTSSPHSGRLEILSPYDKLFVLLQMSLIYLQSHCLSNAQRIRVRSLEVSKKTKQAIIKRKTKKKCLTQNAKKYLLWFWQQFGMVVLLKFIKWVGNRDEASSRQSYLEQTWLGIIYLHFGDPMWNSSKIVLL